MRSLKKSQITKIIYSLREKPIFELKGKLRKDADLLLHQEQELRFNLPKKYKKYLREGIVDKNIKKVFDENNEPLSPEANLSTIDIKNKWELNNGFDQYIIECGKTKINVYYKKFNFSLYGVLDYRAYYNLDKKYLRELNFIFIDVKNTTVKKKICKYLSEKKITSFNLASDMDILAIILCSRDGKDQFKSDILKEFGGDIEFHVYRALRPLYLEKIRVAEAGPDISDLSLDVIGLSKIQKDYSIVSLKDMYKSLHDRKVLIGHSVIYDFVRLSEMRDFALFFNFNEQQEPLFNRYKEISSHIIDLYKLDYDTPPGRGAEKDYTTFYKGAKYLGLLEFVSSDQRAIWEKMIGSVFADSNVFFFPISNFICNEPYGFSDVEFDARCDLYYQKDRRNIYIGNAIREDDITLPDKKIGLEFNSINGNGMILGETQTGKSTTMIKLIEGFIGEKLKVHIINLTKDTIETLPKKFGDKVFYHNLSDLQQSKEGFNSFDEGIHLFSSRLTKSGICEANLDEYDANVIIDAIEKMPQAVFQSRGKKTQNNRPINHVLMIEEAHDFFSDKKSEENMKQFANILEKLSHYGIAIFFITQKLSQLMLSKKESLITCLKNRIIHCMATEEAKDVAELLAIEGIDSHYKLKEDITKLKKGSVFVSFLDQNRLLLPPIKVHIIMEGN